MPTRVKHSYTVPCGAAFRDAVEALAARRHVNVADIARSVLLVVPAAAIEAFPDPGEPAPGERETVTLKSGPAAGRPWRRKPRLQVRMPPGCAVPFVRRALAMALAIDAGRYKLRVGETDVPPPAPVPDEAALRRLDEAREQIERLKAVINVLAFEPLPDGIRSRGDALHVLGFPPTASPDQRMIRAKFRMLATIHHPDGPHGSHERMAQINAAMDLLRRAG